MENEEEQIEPGGGILVNSLFMENKCNFDFYSTRRGKAGPYCSVLVSLLQLILTLKRFEFRFETSRNKNMMEILS